MTYQIPVRPLPPPRPDAKLHVFAFRCRRDLYERVRRAAEAEGVTPGEFLRRAAEAAACGRIGEAR